MSSGGFIGGGHTMCPLSSGSHITIYQDVSPTSVDLVRWTKETVLSKWIRFHFNPSVLHPFSVTFGALKNDRHA